MFLPFKLLTLELKRNDCWKIFLQYRKFLQKLESHNLRIGFLNNCLKSKIIPQFLKFRIPSNGCFDDRTVHDFQVKLLRKEIYNAGRDKNLTLEKLVENREKLKQQLPNYCIPSIILHNRLDIRLLRRSQAQKLNKKLLNLSIEQDKPLLSINNTVICHELDVVPPKYVMETLSLGPKNAVLENFNRNDVLAELDKLLSFCKDKNVSNDLMTDINIKTLTYIKNCSKQKSPRNIQMTKKYLKDHNLLVVPFDKGIGICLMKRVYNNKLNDIIQLPQFEKQLPKRKNEKNLILKEEEKVITLLKSLKSQNKISDTLYSKLKPTGSQPPRLYGLAKIHKSSVPVRPVLSMPGSAYHKIALQVADWLSIVDECKINCSTKIIADSLNEINLADDEELVSFDVVSLYTNVPVSEAINECTNLLYSGKYPKPSVDKETFKKLLNICSRDVLMLTHDGFYKQVDGLAMGSPPAPLLANGWMHKFDDIVKEDAALFGRYMDDYLRNMKSSRVDEKLHELNNLHPNLKFTIEREKNFSLPFLDMLILHDPDGRLSSTWYCKKTDTGLLMNFHALAPVKYKRSVVTGIIHRIFRACSSWRLIHESFEKAKKVLENNQYPPSFYEPIFKKTLNDIITKHEERQEENEEDEELEKTMVFLQYRGKLTERFEHALKKIEAPCKIIMTLRKLKTVLPSLKSPVEKGLKSGVVYEICCSRCNSRYVGQSSRHLTTRIKEHSRISTPVGSHFLQCGVKLTLNDVKILATSQNKNI